MKIKALQKRNPLTNDWFMKGIKEFTELIEEKLIECEESNPRKKTYKLLKSNKNFCGDCCLEFFFDLGSSYKKAIWIKVHNHNGLSIWIRVGFNEKGKKKVNVYSECDLNCIDLDFVNGYALPPNFHMKGIWISEKGRSVSNISFTDISADALKIKS